MSIQAAIRQLANDWYLQTAFILLAVDFVLGVLAALRAGTFRLSYLANFARNDLTKVVAWAVVYIAGTVAPNATVGISALDVSLSTVASAIWVGIAAALLGSILVSLADLGLNMPAALAGRPTGLPDRPGVTGADDLTTRR